MKYQIVLDDIEEGLHEAIFDYDLDDDDDAIDLINKYFTNGTSITLECDTNTKKCIVLEAEDDE